MTDPIAEQLQTVLDPCSIAMGAPRSVWDMGLVESINVEGGRVEVRLVLTDNSCAFFGDIRRHVADAVRAVPFVNDVVVEIDASVMWTPDRMRKR